MRRRWLARQMGEGLLTVASLTRLARAAAARGDPERAGRLWGAVESEEARGPIGGWEWSRDELAEPVLAAAGPEFERGRAEGRRRPLAETVAYALGESKRSNSAA